MELLLPFFGPLISEFLSDWVNLDGPHEHAGMVEVQVIDGLSEATDVHDFVEPAD